VGEAANVADVAVAAVTAVTVAAACVAAAAVAGFSGAVTAAAVVAGAGALWHHKTKVSAVPGDSRVRLEVLMLQLLDAAAPGCSSPAY